jgi:hypothetical protein
VTVTWSRDTASGAEVRALPRVDPAPDLLAAQAMKKLSKRLAFRPITIRPLVVAQLHRIVGGLANTGGCTSDGCTTPNTMACTVASYEPLCPATRDAACGGPSATCLTPPC